MANVKQAEDWHQKVAEKMVREDKTLYAAAMELNIPITSREAENLTRTKTFQRVLWQERHKLQKEIALDPERNKQSLIGQMAMIAQKLIEQDKFDKAAEVLFKLARIEGHVGPETQVTVLEKFTQSELDAAREKLGKLKNEQTVN
jgi:hypothetical protein